MKDYKDLRLVLSKEMHEQILSALQAYRLATGSNKTVVGFIREAIAGKLLAEQINK